MSVRSLRRGSIAASRVVAPSTTNTLYLPGGAANNHASTPDTAANSIATVDIRLDIAPADWTPSSYTLMGKWPSSGPSNRSWIFVLDGTGLDFYYSTTGSNFLSAHSTAATGFTDGTRHWVRVTKSGTSLNYYTSDDGSSWTQLGSTVTVTAGFFDNSRPLVIGADPVGPGYFAGNIYKAQLFNESTATLVNEFDATAVTKLGTRNPLSVVASTGETWTLNGTTWDWQAV